VGELGLEPSSQEKPDRTVALPVVRRPTRPDSLREERRRRLDLVVCVADAERLFDQLFVDPGRGQPDPDPLGAPAVERPPVLGEPPGVSGVVDVAPFAQLVEGRVDRRLVDAVAVEPATQLGFGPVAPAELAKADGQRLVETGLAQAACSRPGSGSIVPTGSFERPSAV
jgi:hypothetical protein